MRLALKSAGVVDPAKELACIAFTKGPGKLDYGLPIVYVLRSNVLVLADTYTFHQKSLV